MSEIKDGGPAFPRPASLLPFEDATPHGYMRVDNQNGMTLRDWFAGQALIGLVSRQIESQIIGTDNISEVAFNFADAMLKAREL